MNTKQQNIAIFESAGAVWIDTPNVYGCIYWPTRVLAMPGDRNILLHPRFVMPFPDSNGEAVFSMPDYCKDLNAMHEVEATLTSDEFNDYMNMVQMSKLHVSSWKALITADAATKAKYYLKVKGIYTE